MDTRILSRDFFFFKEGEQRNGMVAGREVERPRVSPTLGEIEKDWMFIRVERENLML